MKRIWIYITVIALLLAACSTGKTKEEEFKEVPEEKQAEYRQSASLKSLIHKALPERNSKPRVTPITHVVIHFSSNAQEKPEDPYQIQDTYEIFEEYGVSPHYVIDRTGKIYQFVSEDRVAYHAGKGSLEDFPEYENKLNAYSIGVELLAIGTKEEMLPMITEENYDQISPIHIGYTDEQYEALKELLIDISNYYGTIPLQRDHIIGHDEYAPERKTDPGSLFDWGRLMEMVSE